ncbi:unnamed protein product [Onchocerca flexuosa]|uniref:Uncharacterized protein n=1 Tax=Onchocerca flexuosa TaxID=387005 RepID=A0A183HVQ3_9BILA|nr:unnamed protein product [Onchocerca flexuosa]
MHDDDSIDLLHWPNFLVRIPYLILTVSQMQDKFSLVRRRRRSDVSKTFDVKKTNGMNELNEWAIACG